MLNKLQRKLAHLASEVSYQVKLLMHAKNLPTISPQDRVIVEALRKEGAFITSLEQLGLPSTARLLSAAHHYLAVMDSHLPTEDGKVKNHSGVPTFPQIYTVTDLDDFYAWGSEPRLLNLIENYIGLPVEFHGVHLRRDFANDSPVTTEFWHEDLEDRRIIKIFVYLVDVDERRGPFEYIPRTAIAGWTKWQVRFQSWLATRRHILGLDDQQLRKIVPQSLWKPCPGPAGTVVIADTKSVFHHGRNREQCRSALFFVYTAKDPLRPYCCTQYRDLTYARPDVLERAQSTV